MNEQLTLWFNKENSKDVKVSTDPHESFDGFTQVRPPKEPNVVYQFNGKAWVKDEAQTEAFLKGIAYLGLLRELRSRDYRVIKAIRLGKTVEKLYPGETRWYEDTIARIKLLEPHVPERMRR
jgi:hypothetical protein